MNRGLGVTARRDMNTEPMLDGKIKLGLKRFQNSNLRGEDVGR